MNQRSADGLQIRWSARRGLGAPSTQTTPESPRMVSVALTLMYYEFGNKYEKEIESSTVVWGKYHVGTPKDALLPPPPAIA